MAIPLSVSVAREAIHATSTKNGYCTEEIFLIEAKQQWKFNPEKWKWAYGEVESESQRTATCEAEIVESYWKFTVAT